MFRRESANTYEQLHLATCSPSWNLTTWPSENPSSSATSNFCRHVLSESRQRQATTAPGLTIHCQRCEVMAPSEAAETSIVLYSPVMTATPLSPLFDAEPLSPLFDAEPL